MHETAVNPSPDPMQDAHRRRHKPNGDAGCEGTPTPGEVRVGRLDTLPAIRNELSRLYRAARKVAGHSPSPSDATKLGWLLNAMATAVATTELAARVEALEEKRNPR
jgi:hypothetical protein